MDILEDRKSSSETSVVREPDPHKRFWIVKDVTDKALASRGFKGRAETMLGLSLSMASHDSLSGYIIEGKTLNINTDTVRHLIEERIAAADSSANDCLWANHDSWSSYLLDSDYLLHTFTQNRAEFLTDSQVAYMLACFTFGSWGRTKGGAYAETVDVGTQEELQHQAVKAIEAAKKDGWHGIAAVAKEFAASPISSRMREIAEVWNEKYFNPGSISGGAVDNIIEINEAITKPDLVMEAAKEIYREGFGLDLEKVKPIVTPSFYGDKYKTQEDITTANT